MVEMMLTLLVLAVLLAFAVPSFNQATLGSRLSAVANDLVASAQIARSEAIKRNAPVTLCRSVDRRKCATSGGWQDGWLVVDLRNPLLDNDNVVLQYRQALPSGFRIWQETFGVVTFPATVVGVTPATFTVCRTNPVGKQERVVTIKASGAASVSQPDAPSDCEP